MLITFGNRFFGKVATAKGHWVETKFFSIMFIPIFPVSSFFVTEAGYNKRNGFGITLNNTSIIATYGRLLSFLIAAWLLFMGYSAWADPGLEGSASGKFIYPVMGIAFVAIWVYFCWFYGKATPGDMVIREKVGIATGYYALPHWFSYPQLRNMLGEVQMRYKIKYPDSDWKTDLMNHAIETEKLPLLYALALFNCMVFDLPENDDLYARADSLYLVTIPI